nr:peptidase S8 and S53, subtilisin, kexin, sedolisin [uncultured archaeon]UVT38851.1 peptidase S8 and S53, subtilisin, kexin, sedolisin [uncultured bacterium]
MAGEEKRPAAAEEGPVSDVTGSIQYVGARGAGETGAGAIAINLDTGACPDQFSAGRRMDGYNATDEEGPWSDGHGHGSYTLGIMAGDRRTQGVDKGGVAPGTDLYPVKVLNSKGEGTTGMVIEALDAVIALAENNPGRPVVVNNSWGISRCSGLCGSPLTKAVSRVADVPNVYMVFAAGNMGMKCGQGCSDTGISGPNSLNNVLTVAATGRNGYPEKLHRYSSRGGEEASCGSRKPDVAAPIYGTVPWGCGARDIGNLGGTSGACPHVAGAVALATAAANGVPPASDVFDALRETAEGKKWDGCRGHGVIDAGAAVDTVSTGGIKIAGMSPSTVAGAILASVALTGLTRKYIA